MLTKKEKIIAISVISALVLINIGLLVWYFLSSSSKSEEQNQNADNNDQTEQQVDPIAYIEIEDYGKGLATLYIDLDEPSTLAGAEIYLKKEGSLTVTDVVCKTGFRCLDAGNNTSVVSVIALRPPTEDFSALSGRIAVADIMYAPSTSGTLTMNATGVTKSIVSSIDTTNNLISVEEASYNVGK